LEGYSLCFLVLTKSVQTAGFEGVDVPVVVVSAHQLVVNINGFLVITIMEGAIGDSKVSFDVVSV